MKKLLTFGVAFFMIATPILAEEYNWEKIGSDMWRIHDEKMGVYCYAYGFTYKALHCFTEQQLKTERKTKE